MVGRHARDVLWRALADTCLALGWQPTIVYVGIVDVELLHTNARRQALAGRTEFTIANAATSAVSMSSIDLQLGTHFPARHTVICFGSHTLVLLHVCICSANVGETVYSV